MNRELSVALSECGRALSWCGEEGEGCTCVWDRM